MKTHELDSINGYAKPFSDKKVFNEVLINLQSIYGEQVYANSFPNTAN